MIAASRRAQVAPPPSRGQGSTAGSWRFMQHSLLVPRSCRQRRRERQILCRGVLTTWVGSPGCQLSRNRKGRGLETRFTVCRRCVQRSGRRFEGGTTAVAEDRATRSVALQPLRPKGNSHSGYWRCVAYPQLTTQAGGERFGSTTNFAEFSRSNPARETCPEPKVGRVHDSRFNCLSQRIGWVRRDA